MRVRIPVNTTGFWLVWSPDMEAPNKRHPNIGEARSAAEALALANPGTSFYVMQPVLNAHMPTSPVWPMQPMPVQGWPR